MSERPGQLEIRDGSGVLGYATALVSPGSSVVNGVLRLSEVALTSTKAGLPTAGIEGHLRRVTDDVRGLWMDTGVQWFSLSGEVVNVKEFGAIADGNSHPLSGRYASLAAAQVVYPHATSLTNEIDWAALQGALNLFSNQSRSGKLFMPSGVYVVDQPLIFRGNTGHSFMLEGVGPGVFGGSVIKWSGAASQIMFSALGAYNFGMRDLCLNGIHRTTSGNGALVTLLLDYDYSRSQGFHNADIENVTVYGGGVSGVKAVQFGTGDFQASEIYCRHLVINQGSGTYGTEAYGLWTENANVKNFNFHGLGLGGFQKGISYQGSGLLNISGLVCAYNTVVDIEHIGAGSIVIHAAETEGSRAAYMGPSSGAPASAHISGWQFHGQLVDAGGTATNGTVLDGGTGGVHVENCYFDLGRVPSFGGSYTFIEPRLNTSGSGTTTSGLYLRNVHIESGSGAAGDIAPIYAGGGGARIDSASFLHDLNSAGTGSGSLIRAACENCTGGSASGAGIFKYADFGLGDRVVAPILRVTELGGYGDVPLLVGDLGAGTNSGTWSVVGNYLAGTLTLTTGSSPAAATNMVKVWFGNYYLKAIPHVVLTPVNDNAAALSGATQVYVDYAQTTRKEFYIVSGPTALAAATQYKWTYHVIQ